MKYTINLKYNIGDEVKYIGNGYHHCYGVDWSGGIPDEDNHWKVNAYRVEIDENGICVKYCFHTYCNKWFEYHELIDEGDLEPISTPNPQTIEFEPKDVFGNVIEIGDMGYYDFYTKSSYSNPPDIPKCTSILAFQNRGYIKKFIKSKNMWSYYDESVEFEDTGEVFTNGGIHNISIEPLSSIMVKTPDTFVDDMARMGLKRGLMGNDMERFKTITGWLGKTDECVEAYEKLKEQKEKEREYNRQRRTKTKKKRKKGSASVRKPKKPKSIDEIRSENEKMLDELTNTMSLYAILRKDREDNPFAINNDILGKLIESVKKPENKSIVHAVFFNNNFDKTDDQCVTDTLEVLTDVHKAFDENPTTRRGVEAAISIVENIMNKEDSTFNKIRQIYGKKNVKFGQTELVSDEKLIKKIVDSDFVIFNKGSFVLDAYGSKMGEFANYIFSDEVKRTKGLVDSEKYYVLCYTHLIYELNKLILSEKDKNGKPISPYGVNEDHILLCKTVEDIDTQLGKLMGGNKFSVIVGNPPYMGKANPLYMKITKTLYDHNMADDGVMCMINPTALIDNKYEGSKFYEDNKERYKDLKLVGFDFDPTIKGTFTSAEIGNNLGIFTYKKVEDEDKSLYSNWVKEIRFGKGYLEEKAIADICKSQPSMKSYSGYVDITDGNESKRDDIIETLDKPYYMITSYNRGNQDKKSGGVKWDWTTILNDINLVVQTKVPNKRWNVFGFDDRNEAIKWIQWVNTDLVQFLIYFYKTQMSNNPVLYTFIPQPPVDGDFSDEALEPAFGLTDDQMKIIHDKIKDVGIDNSLKFEDFGVWI